MIPTRVEKLKLIAEEMEIAFHLASHVTDPFVARTLVRHILIRAENFIEHARGLRSPLNAAHYDARDFHKTKEAYATAFDEYFKLARHRLGAHVQDFDFGKRIELWNDIEIVKIAFFVDGAQEIYCVLAALSLPGYVPYAEPAELADAAVPQILGQFERSIDASSGIELGTDPLAMTRNNTAATLNITPVHARAGQLALIRRWITLQRELLDRFAMQPRIARILKARIITDIVSFCDCLVTRPVSPGAPQQMDGLDRLVVATGQSAAPIDAFVAATNFHSDVQTARAIRDTVGAHVEIDPGHTVASLMTDLDGYDLDQGLRFYGRVEAAFIKTCLNVFFLRMYAADGQRIYGVLAGSTRAVPFAGQQEFGPQPVPAPPPVNDEEAYRKNLTRWLDGDATQRGEARSFFWHAFAGSQVIETIDEVECVGTGQRMTRHEVRKAHKFLESALSEGLSDSDFGGVLDLILSCRTGWPYPLAEVLVRYGRGASIFRQGMICYALGEIASAPHASVTAFLEGHGRSSSWPIRLQAALARYKTFVMSEGIFRINRKGETSEDYDALVDALIARMTDSERLVTLLAFASNLSGPRIGSFSQPFAKDYARLQAHLETLCQAYLESDQQRVTTLKQLIQTNDYIGVCVHLAANLGDENPLRAALVDSCCNGTILPAGHDQASRHLAIAFYLKKDHRTAFEIADGLASRNPDWTDIQVLATQILGDTPGAETETTHKIAGIRRGFKLTASQEASLAAIESEIARRKAQG